MSNVNMANWGQWPQPRQGQAQGQAPVGFGPMMPAPGSMAMSGQAADYGGANVRELGASSARGEWLNAEANPYLMGAMETALKPITRSYTESIFPQLSSNAVMSGAYGGDADMIERQKAARSFGETAADTLAKIGYQNYATERQNQLNSGSLIQQGLGIEMLPAQIQAQIGAEQAAMNQEELNAQMAAYQAQQEAPWSGLANLSTAVQGGQFNNSYTSGGRQSALSGALKGGLSGLGLAAAAAPQGTALAAMGGPWGIGLGLAGALLGGLS